MKTSVSFSVRGVPYSSIEFDAATAINHAGDVDVTEHPVETGFNVADGARPKQPTLQIDGIISDFPLSFVNKTLGRVQGIDGLWFVDQSPGGEGQARSKYAALVSVKNAGAVVTVTTPLAKYKNMVIKSLSTPESVQMGRAVKFTMQFVQVRIIRSQTVELQKTDTPQGQPQQKDGPKTGTPATAQQTAKTFWQRLSKPLVVVGD